jgi:hypothetical protein
MERYTLLTSVGSELESELIKSILVSQDIPVLVKHRGSGSYLNIYMGMSIEGIDILVPEDCLEEAHELIQDKGEEIDLQDASLEDKDLDNYRDNYNDKTRNRMLILMLILTIPTLLAFIVNAFKH